MDKEYDATSEQAKDFFVLSAPENEMGIDAI